MILHCVRTNMLGWREIEERGVGLGMEGSQIPHSIFAPLQYWGDLEGKISHLKHFKCIGKNNPIYTWEPKITRK